MISMARSLDLEVVAEGIETEGQRAFLRSGVCEVGQGFLMSRPIDADAFAELLPAIPRPTSAGLSI